MSENNQFESLNNCELFDLLWEEIKNSEEKGSKYIYNDSMNILRSCANEKKIEFDGYFQSRWEDSANTIINFDEDYFDDEDRRDLYVFLSALVDEEIFLNLKKIIRFTQQIEITKEFLNEKILFLTKTKGVKF